MASQIRDLVNNILCHFCLNLPPKSYTFEFDPISSRYLIRLKVGNEMAHCHKYADKFDAFYISSKSGNNIACVMIKAVDTPPSSASNTTPSTISSSCSSSNFTILFNHGGTVDLGNLCNFLYTLGQRLHCNVFVYDYSGFGASKGTPTEKAVFADAQAALETLIDKYGITLNNVVLYGQSLGTGPSLYLASLHTNIRGVILHSPFLSALTLFFPNANSSSWKFYDYYKNVDMINKTSAPLLIMHGTKDCVVPIEHAKILHTKCVNAVTPLWIDGGGHDDLYMFDSYMRRLKRFVEFDITSSTMITTGSIINSAKEEKKITTKEKDSAIVTTVNGK